MKIKANNLWNLTNINPIDNENGDTILVLVVETDHEIEDYESSDDGDVQSKNSNAKDRANKKYNKNNGVFKSCIDENRRMTVQVRHRFDDMH